MGRNAQSTSVLSPLASAGSQLSALYRQSATRDFPRRLPGRFFPLPKTGVACPGAPGAPGFRRQPNPACKHLWHNNPTTMSAPRVDRATNGLVWPRRPHHDKNLGAEENNPRARPHIKSLTSIPNPHDYESRIPLSVVDDPLRTQTLGPPDRTTDSRPRGTTPFFTFFCTLTRRQNG